MQNSLMLFVAATMFPTDNTKADVNSSVVLTDDVGCYRSCEVQL